MSSDQFCDPSESSATTPVYGGKPDAVSHSCWDTLEWDGEMQVERAGCDETAAHPCRFCGYEHVFTTHNIECHAENGDALTPAWDDSSELADKRTNSPHVVAEDTQWQRPNGIERTPGCRGSLSER
jgi:hypothetical protein